MYFKRHIDRLTTANLGTKDPVELIHMLQDDVDVLAKLFQINLSHLSGRPDARGTQGAWSPRRGWTFAKYDALKIPIRYLPSPQLTTYSDS